MTLKLQSLINIIGRTRLWLAVFGVLVIAVIVIGLNNVAGIVLSYLATLILMTKWTYRWGKVRNFIMLFFGSLVGIIFLSFLHQEVAYPLAVLIAGGDVIQSGGWFIFHVVISLVITFGGAAGLFIGIVGSVTLIILRLAAIFRRRKRTAGT